MARTQQLGTTLLLPWPKRPCCHKTYCLYAVCLKFSLFRGWSRTRTSSLYLMAISSTLPSKTSCWKRGVVEMHGIFLIQQHLFSACVGMILHSPHLHQSGVSSGVGVPGPGCGWTCMFISPFTKSANTAGCLRKSSKASLWRTSKLRFSTKFCQWNQLLFVNYSNNSTIKPLILHEKREIISMINYRPPIFTVWFNSFHEMLYIAVGR